ncbi:MAG: hypothetical protein Q8M17_13785 [Actinomycetota bacterium]|nr:hypothetical protein [Actinomycetota bacterium]
MGIRDEPGEPIDPVYESLFRPDVEPANEPPIEPIVLADQPLELPDDPGPATHDDLAAPAEPEPEPPADSPAAPRAVTADTGRLFRSQGVEGHADAVLALSSAHAGRLRTLDRSGPPEQGPDGSPSPDARGDSDVSPGRRQARRDDARSRRAAAGTGHGISAGAVYLIVIVVTVAVAFVNAWLGSGELGWPTGVALLASSVYCALRVRRDDDVVAIITPPIAFLLAALTAGQAFRGASGGGLLNRTQLVFFTLAYNWYWVIGTTVVVLVIVVFRRRAADE